MTLDPFDPSPMSYRLPTARALADIMRGLVDPLHFNGASTHPVAEAIASDFETAVDLRKEWQLYRCRTRLSGVEIALTRRRNARADTEREAASDVATYEAWQDRGLRQHTPMRELRRSTRVALLLGLALLDIGVYAAILSVGLDIEPSLREPMFWVALGLGGAVLVTGWAFAGELKRLTIAAAQRELAALHPGSEQPFPITINPLALALPGATFALLFGLGMSVRLAGETEDLAAALVAGMVPLVVVAIEYLLSEPLKPHIAPSSWSERLLERRQSRLKHRLAAIEMAATAAKRSARAQLGLAQAMNDLAATPYRAGPERSHSKLVLADHAGGFRRPQSESLAI